jgi:hypothetical protein
MGDIGKPGREITFEPIEEPLTVPQETPATPERDPELVPA